MTTFKALPESKDIQEFIKSTFDVDLALNGGWGYTQENPTIINSLPEGMPLPQLEHMLTSMRAHLEMNITQEKENRFGGINANEKSREAYKNNESSIDKITYEVTATKEDLYMSFIKEYKEGYGKEGFNLTEHFKRREEATLVRKTVHYFEVGRTQ